MRAGTLLNEGSDGHRMPSTQGKSSERSREMSDSVYRVTEVIGVSPESWEAAARNAVETAARTVRDLRIAEATRFDLTVQDGKVASYRVRLDISFKYEGNCRSGERQAPVRARPRQPGPWPAADHDHHAPEGDHAEPVPRRRQVGQRAPGSLADVECVHRPARTPRRL